MTDCRCTGAFPFGDSPCDEPATENGYCELCITNGCEAKRREITAYLRERSRDLPEVARILARAEAE